MLWIVTAWLCVQFVWSETTVCSDYLLSGFNGVENSAFTASSIFASEYSAYNARLYYDGLYSSTGVSSSWSSATLDVNQQIQVKLPRETVVKKIIMQGRKDTIVSQWVTSYYLMYSMDGTNWSTVTSLDGSSQLFTGNSDRNTLVTSDIPNITAVYIRINPRSWNDHISLRFDVSGCQVTGQTPGQSKHIRMIPSSDLHQYLVSEAASSSMPECIKSCHRNSTCVSFTYDANQNICRGYNATVPSTGKFSRSTDVPYFVNKDILASLGYKQDFTVDIFYKVNEIGRNQATATIVCKEQYSRLFKVDSASKMTVLQNMVSGNIILIQDYRFYVSGQYVSQQWQFSDGQEVIDSALWTPSNPDPAQGHCVMLTATGLASVDCLENLFFICEK